MRQNNNQYNLADRRKTLFLIAGILVILAAIMLVIYLFTDRTNASTGYGDAVCITPDHIERISDDVGEQVLDTLSTDVLADMVRESAAKELTKEKIYKVISDGNVDVVAIGDDELLGVVKRMLEDIGVSGSQVFTDEQKKYIRLTINRTLKDGLDGVDVTQPLSETEKKQLTEQLRQELSEMLQNQIQNSTYRLTDQELAKIKHALNLESLITAKVNTITKQQLERLQENISERVQKTVKTPVKGVDYLTKTEIKAIQDDVLKKAGAETLRQMESLTAKISEVKISVNTLTKQIRELKTLDKEKTSDLTKLQQSIREINTSIQDIHSVTENLTSAVAVTGNNLEKVSGSGSELQSSKVSAAHMTVAEFVDILAGNDQVYTGAVRELNQIVKELKDENTKQDTEFDKSLKQLEHSLDDNGKEMDDVKAQLEKSDQEIKKELEQQSKEQNEKLDQQSKDQERKLEQQSKDQDKKLEQQSKEQDKKLEQQSKEQDEKLEQQSRDQDQKLQTEQSAREEADQKLQSQIDDTNALIGDKEEAGKVQGETIFQKIGSIIKILSAEGIDGLRAVLKGIGGAETLGEGVENLNTDLTDARQRVRELEKEKWYSNLTLLTEAGQDGTAGYAYEESGSAYVYRIPLVSDADEIDLNAEDTAIVIEFKKPDRLPSNAAFTTSGNDLLITFTNRPTRNIEIVSIHVYKKK